MYLFLILFFVSLIAIIIMIGSKLVLVRNGHVVRILHPHAHHLQPELEKVKNLTLRGTKKIGYITVFLTLRFFLLSSNFIKTNGKAFLKELRNRIKKSKGQTLEDMAEKKEVSKYLKVISEYRHKIRQMKHRIKEQEGIE